MGGQPQTVADLTADTFVAAITSLATFDPRKGTARAWVLGITAALAATSGGGAAAYAVTPSCVSVPTGLHITIPLQGTGPERQRRLVPSIPKRVARRLQATGRRHAESGALSPVSRDSARALAKCGCALGYPG
jgi:hypothetical protein